MESLINISAQQKITVMMTVLLAMFLSALDQTIVSTAVPSIAKDFNAFSHLSWVFTAYMLTSTITVPIYGKLSDLYGRKTFYMFGIILFLIGSALCGLAENMSQLIIFRALQGIGGGAIMTNSFAIIGDLFDPRQRSKWQGVMGGVFALSSIIGPLIGGFFTDQLSWRWCFYINMPLGLLALINIFFKLPKTKSYIKDKSIDYFGALFLTLALTSLLLALVSGGTSFAWNSYEILLLFGFFLITSALFIFKEKNAKNPIISLNLFKNSIFSLSVLISFFTAIGMFGVVSYIPLFAQKVIGISATSSGTILSPLMFSMVFSNVLSGQIVAKTGKYKAIAIFGLFISFMAMMALSKMNATTTQFDLLKRMIFIGLGLGMNMPIFNIVIQNAFHHSKIGIVTAATQLFRSVGGTVGVAIMGGIINAYISKDPNSLANAISAIFFVAMLFMFGALILSIFLKEIPLKQSEDRNALEQAGIELAVEEGQFSARNEPKL